MNTPKDRDALLALLKRTEQFVCRYTETSPPDWMTPEMGEDYRSARREYLRDLATHIQTLSAPAVERQGYSRMAFWLAKAAMNLSNNEVPKVGDWAIEVSHLIGCARRGLARNDAIGRIVELNGTGYVIETQDGRRVPWENAYFKKLAALPTAPGEG